MQNKDHYDEMIQQEAKVWGDAALEWASKTKPDWQFMKHLSYNVILHGPEIELLLSKIQPGWRVLEIGCSSGWVSLEMARRGAHVLGIDIASSAIQLAQEYAKTVTVAGSVTYQVADINYMPIEPSSYDLIAIPGALHHFAEIESIIERCRTGLKPDGLFYVVDVFDTPKINALIAGGLMLILPTHLSYGEKFRHLLRLRQNSLEHMTASIEARGLSPFEGYGRHFDPLEVIKQKFEITLFEQKSAFVGYIIAQLNLPDPTITVVGRFLGFFDKILVKLHLLHGLNYLLLAKPRQIEAKVTETPA